jgi:phosphoribosylanthranilate isomerase
LVIAVTVLTSLDDVDLKSVGQSGPTENQVLRLARLTREANLDGIVCSAQEAETLRAALGPDFKLIVPGIRPAGSAVGDQKRVMGPKEAIQAGADFLVVGRPITEANDRQRSRRRRARNHRRHRRRDRQLTMSVDVKICGINSEPALDAAIEGGARYVGFIFFPPSPRFLFPSVAAALSNRVPSSAGVTRVGVFVDPTIDSLDDLLMHVPLDMIQLHGHESPEEVEAIRYTFRLPVMKAIGIRNVGDFDQVGEYATVADQLLFDAKAPEGAALPGGNALAFNWGLMAGRTVPLPWMLSGGLDSKNLAEAVRASGATAVDVSSGVETEPGRKDPALIKAFLAAAGRL